MAMKYRHVSKNGKYKTRWRPGPVDAIMMAHRAKPRNKGYSPHQPSQHSCFSS